MPRSIYISDDEIVTLLKRYSLEVDNTSDIGLSDADVDLLIEEAVGEFESKMCSRFIVPLIGISGSFDTAPASSQTKAKICIKAMIRIVLSRDHGVNTDFGSSDNFKNQHLTTFNSHIKDFLDVKKLYGFKRQSFAGDASQPVQSVGLARGNNEFESF